MLITLAKGKEYIIITVYKGKTESCSKKSSKMWLINKLHATKQILHAKSLKTFLTLSIVNNYQTSL